MIVAINPHKELHLGMAAKLSDMIIVADEEGGLMYVAAETKRDTTMLEGREFISFDLSIKTWPITKAMKDSQQFVIFNAHLFSGIPEQGGGGG